MMHGVVLLFAALVGVWLLLLLAYAKPLAACWREPVLRRPVLIFESDDWGAGPLEQAGALEKIVGCLAGFRDQAGHPAVMTLGIILEVPDGPRIRQDECRAYHGLRIGAPDFASIRSLMATGIGSGVLAPQLHGLTHYRPSTLLNLAGSNPQLREWLTGSSPAATESLPDALQSNWIDATRLPPLQLTDVEIERAVGEACALYGEFFGPPRIAVATTFVWNDRVELAWAKQGVDTVITPGRRYTSRNTRGQPDAVDAQTYNGMISPQGLLYLVRDVYFEPARGHTPDRVEAGVAARTALGRPTLVETHRFNFLGRAEQTSLDALSDALARVMARWPEIRFLSSAELAHAYRTHNPDWIDDGFGGRARTWAKRVRELPRFWKLARLTGLGWVLALVGSA
ncbi:MAG TPA: hypothetical protein VEP67_04300 [Thiobacillaceae bacterium]|nr:hypothetical protein [Thiobacillaceae bacterium]